MNNLKWIKVYSSSLLAKQNHLGGNISRHYIEGKTFCMVYSEGKIFAFEDHCPHKGLSFVGGNCKFGIVECPIHKYKFPLEVENGKSALHLLAVKENENGIYVGFKKGFWD